MRMPFSSLPSHTPDDPSGSAAAEPLAPLAHSDVEVSHLGRYVGVVVLLAACAMLSAWSRIDLIETSAALGSAEARLEAARAENARLSLEQATLTDPVRLQSLAAEQGLQGDVTVIELGEAP